MFWSNSTTTTTSTVLYEVASTVASDITALISDLELSPVFHAPPPPSYFKPLPRRHRLERARHGFQQMCRIPCYRGVRTR